MIGHFQHRKLGWSSKWLWSLKIAYRMIPSSIHGWSKIIEGSLEVKLRTVWTDEKQRWEESEKRREEKKKKEDQKRESLRRKNDPGLRKGRKVAKHCVFPMICGSGGSTSTKAAGAEPAGQMRDEKLHAGVARSTFRSQNVQSTPWLGHFSKLRCRKSARPLWLEAHFEVTMCKTHYVQTTFGSCDVEKLHAGVARSTFRSQNVQSNGWTTFRSCDVEKVHGRCGSKHISKSQCTKHTMFRPLLEVAMSKNCTPVWREAHFEVKSVKNYFKKNWQVWTTFGNCDVVSRGKRKGLCTLSKWAKREGFVAFPKTMAGVGHLKRIWQDAFRVAAQYKGHVHQRC